VRGHLRKRGAVWYAVLSITEAGGKRRQKWVNTKCHRKADAERRLRAILDEYDRGIAPHTLTVERLAGEWLATHGIRSSTRRAYLNALDSYILPHLGHLRVQQLSPMHIQVAMTQLAERLAPATIRHAHGVLHRMLVQAVRWRIIGSNPADGVELPRVPRTAARAWSSEQVGRFLRAAEGDRFYAAYWLALATGLRQGELMGLEWDDIDWARQQIRISRALTRTTEGRVLTPPKSGRPRLIAIGLDTVAVLQAHRRREAEKHRRLGILPSGRILTGDLCTPATVRTLVRSFDLLVAKVPDLPRIRWHDLRHTHATLLLEAGEHPKVVAERLGHSRIATTLDTYSHVLPQMQERAAEKADSLLTAAGAETPTLQKR